MTQDKPKKQFLQYTVTVTFEVPAEDPGKAGRIMDDLYSAASNADSCEMPEVKKVRTVKR